MFRFKMLATAALIAGLSLGAAQAQTLRIGLNEDADALDPTTARSFVGRIVFMGLCDKLFDIDANLNIVPQLATGYEWSADNRSLTIRLRPNVMFHDGERMDAEAVRFSLDRHLNMQGSSRRAEISTIQSIDVVDPLTVRITLSAPFAPFVAQLTDRAGMIVSPRAAREAGANFAARPVCAGPMRFVERVAQDRIVLERFAQYWDAANIHIARVEYRPIPDSTVRATNLQAGALEMAERVAATDVPALRRNNRLSVVHYDSLGYNGITINVGNGDRARAPIGSNPRIREAFDLAIDRNVINQVVYNGEFTPTVQAVPPASPYHARAITPPARNLDRARALLREAGNPNPVVNLTVINTPDQRQIGEIIQAMAREAGFDVRVQAVEFAALLQSQQRGDFEATIIGWSGRVDPDGNIYSFLFTGAPLNDGHYSNPQMDSLLNQTRATNELAARQRLWTQVAELSVRDRPIIYLVHPRNFVAMSTRVTGYRPISDGMIRLQGMRVAAN